MQFSGIWHNLLQKLGGRKSPADLEPGAVPALAPTLAWRLLHSWFTPAALGGVLLLTLIFWALPRRVEKIVSATGQPEWQVENAPSRRQVVWGTPLAIEELVPYVAGQPHLSTPRLTDGGTALYFTMRIDEGHADLYRSRLVDGRWQPAVAVAELNSPADDIGPALSPDGRLLCFCSDRSGGEGGFDLYVAERKDQGWGPPRNMGPIVNSPADEQDPALHVAGDRISLFFASNRATQSEKERAAGTGDSKPPVNESETNKPADGAAADSAATAEGDDALFDLYVSGRAASEADWSAPMNLGGPDLARSNEAAHEKTGQETRPTRGGPNLAKSNEAAPFVSPDGTHVYFSSDRPARRGEKRNLDLYRARRIGDRFGAAENLGPGINTSATETEPALSPEGYTLVFASDREGTDSLYRSAAQEVYIEQAWDSSRWQAFVGVWWRALVLALLVAAAGAMLWYAYRWVSAKASAVRFFVASIAFHGLLVLLMWKTPLGMAVVQIVEEIRTKAEALQLFDDNLHQSHAPGTEAYEKIADLKSLNAIDAPEMVRQVRDLPNVPLPANAKNLVPTVPVQVARAMPANRVMFVPARDEPPVVRQLTELKRQTLPPSVQLAMVDPQPMELPAGAAVPAEAPVDRKPVEVPRELAGAVTNPGDLPRRMAVRPDRPPVIELDLVEQPEPQEIKTLERPPDAARPEPPPEKKPSTEDLASIEMAVAVAVPAEEPAVVVAATPLNRADPSEPVPVPEAAKRPNASSPVMPKSDRGLDKPVELPADAPTIRSAQEPPEKAAAPVVRVEFAAKLPDQATPAETGTLNVPNPAEASLSGETIPVERSEALRVDVEVRVPPELAGPRTTSKPRLVIGTLADESVEAPPSLSPLANTLTRFPAKATPVAYAEDNVGLRAMFTLREGENRRQFIDLFGGNEATEAAVNRGLKWLAVHQDPAGSWSLNNFHANCKGKHADCPGAGGMKSDVAATAFALLPFLAAGHTTQKGDYQAAVTKGVDWLISKQKPDGQLLSEGDGQPMYTHGLGSIALCEVFGMTQDEKFKGPAQRALLFIEKAQHAPSGGWRYGPNESGDTSVVGWQVMALKSGEMAGLTVPPPVLEGAKRWLASVESNQPAGGLFGYVSPGPTPAMTAEGMLCLEFLGVRRNDPRMRAGADYLLKNLPDQSNAASTSYYWYYATQALYHMQGDYWTAWNDKLRDSIVATQVMQGDVAGTWAPRDAWETTGGRIFATSLRLLMLEVYYRHLPLYQQLDD